MQGTSDFEGAAARLDSDQVLVDKTAPGLSTPIAQYDAVTVRNAGYRTAIGIPERVAHRFVADLFRGAAPNVAELVTKPEVIAMTKSVQARTGCFLLEIEEATRHAGVNSLAFEDASTDHQVHYPGFRC